MTISSSASRRSSGLTGIGVGLSIIEINGLSLVPNLGPSSPCSLFCSTGTSTTGTSGSTSGVVSVVGDGVDVGGADGAVIFNDAY